MFSCARSPSSRRAQKLMIHARLHPCGPRRAASRRSIVARAARASSGVPRSVICIAGMEGEQV